MHGWFVNFAPWQSEQECIAHSIKRLRMMLSHTNKTQVIELSSAMHHSKSAPVMQKQQGLASVNESCWTMRRQLIDSLQHTSTMFVLNTSNFGQNQASVSAIFGEQKHTQNAKICSIPDNAKQCKS